MYCVFAIKRASKISAHHYIVTKDSKRFQPYIEITNYLSLIIQVLPIQPLFGYSHTWIG
jgi:hypothetical protein